MRLTTIQLQPTVPEGWYHKQSTTLLGPAGDANVIASSEPLDPSMDTDRYAEVQLTLLRRDFPQFVVLSSGRLTLGGDVPAIWRQFRWTPPDGVSVTQLQLYAVVDDRGLTATATTPTVIWDRYEALFHDVFRTMVVAVAKAGNDGSSPSESGD